MLSKAHSVIWHSHAQYHIIIYNIKVYNKSNHIKLCHSENESDTEWYTVKEKESQIRKETDWESERKKERKKEIRRGLVRNLRYQKRNK